MTRKHTFKPMLEALEDRQLLSSMVQVTEYYLADSNKTIIVQGTDLNDNIAILRDADGFVSVKVDGQEIFKETQRTSYTTLAVWGSWGDDVIDNQTFLAMRAHGGGGDDRLIGGGARS